MEIIYTRDAVNSMKKLSWKHKSLANGIIENIQRSQSKDLKEVLGNMQAKDRDVRVRYNVTDRWVEIIDIFVKSNHETTLYSKSK